MSKFSQLLGTAGLLNCWSSLLFFLLFSLALNSLAGGADWPGWRGPLGNNLAPADARPPIEFGEELNVLWKVPVPGRGHASPVIVGSRIYLATALETEQQQGVVCFDLQTGKQLWWKPILEGGFPAQIHRKNTHASCTVTATGERIFVTFYNKLEVVLAALSPQGEVLWKVSTGEYHPERYKFGYAASPLVFEKLVIVAAESDNGSFLAAFAQTDGREVWRTPRPEQVSYSSPIVGEVAGRQQLLTSGFGAVWSYDPRTGHFLWSTPGTARATCGTLVWEGDLVFASGGFPESQTVAVVGDGTKRVVWENNQKCYEQSLLVHAGFVYGHTDAGVLYCWRASDGEEMWRSRLGGNVSSSPLLANGYLYAANEAGEIFVIKANPQQFELVTKTRLGNELFATPAVSQDRLIYRIAEGSGESRQEYLYCLANLNAGKGQQTEH